MRAWGRNDVTLLAGLAVAALVIFQRPIWHFFQVGRDIEERYGLALVPGLVILTVVFLGNVLLGRITLTAVSRVWRCASRPPAARPGVSSSASTGGCAG